MTFNTTFVNESVNFADLLTGINNSSGGLVIGTILILVFLIIYISMRNFDSKVVFITASFVTTLLSMIFWYAEMLPFGFLVFPFIVLMASILIKFMYDS